MEMTKKAQATLKSFNEHLDYLYDTSRKRNVTVDCIGTLDMVYAVIEARDVLDKMITYNFVITKRGSMYQVEGKHPKLRKKYAKTFFDLKVRKY